jgi:probable F420-dependent oxidoreductase
MRMPCTTACDVAPTCHSGRMSAHLPLLGFGLPVSGRWATRGNVVRLAHRAEELGYAAVWGYQRTLWPADGRLGPSHRTVLDPVVALALAAGRTERIGLGTATVCAPFTPPALLASTMASLDVVSGGRLTVGVGMGWLPEEHVAAGVPMQRRGARFEEYLRCLLALWTQQPVEFAGDFYTVPRSFLSPAPVQRPHPPLLVGGTAEPALRRAGRLAQGWIASSRLDPGSLARCVEVVRGGAIEAGRDPRALRIVARVVPDLLDADPGRGRAPFRGTAEQLHADLAQLARHGATEVILDLNLSPRVGTADVEQGRALALAERLLEQLAPSGVGGTA